MMRETTFEVHVPANLLEFGFDRDMIQRYVNEWLVLSLFTEGQISSGKAARLLDITRIEFLGLLRRHSIAYIDYTPEELQQEFETVDTLKLGLST
jgi:predicted HTH domain antitoxin